MTIKKKRYYKQDEQVWVLPKQCVGKVHTIHKDETPIRMTVTYEEDGQTVTFTDAIWRFDKLKEFNDGPEEDNGVLASVLSLVNGMYSPKVYFAKVRDQAIIPSKRVEDAGYDIYAELSGLLRETEEGPVMEIECPVLATTLVPTGLAVAMPNTHYLNLKHERGSTGVQSMSVLAGVVDSGFRNEMFIALTPLRKSVILTNQVEKVEENDTHIFYPLSKAIAQGTIDFVPRALLEEISYEELQNIASDRGVSMLGDSGK